MTDEAWLALFEMVEANEPRGKVQRWDAKAMARRPDKCLADQAARLLPFTG